MKPRIRYRAPSERVARPQPFPTSDEIAARAHDLFVSGGRQIRRIREYWLIAERELLEKAAARTLGTSD